MVQRKLPPKLTLQPHTLSLSHHHDLKSPRGADLKAKKMKKSGSIKRPKQPGKPPPPPPTTTLPNYMKPTTSSDARKEKSQPPSKSKEAARTLTKNPSFKPARAGGVVRRRSVVCENLDAKKPTCSSTLKDCKFPAYLSLSPGGTETAGTSVIKVCPYTYCSLNGHHRAPLPPLKCFLSERRRAVKTQRSLVLGCPSSPRRVGAVGDDNDDDDREEQGKCFFLEIFTADGDGGDETVAEDQEERVCDDFDGENEEISFEERIEEFLSGSESDSDTTNDDFCEADSDSSEMEWATVESEPEPEADPEAEVSNEQIIKDEFMVGSDSYDQNLVDVVSQESLDEDGFTSDAFSTSDDDLQSLSSFNSSASLQAQAGARDEENPAMDHEDAAERETEDVALLQFTAKSKEAAQDGDELGDFNPRAPNFLPVEPDPEAEKVDLRHQDLDERKNSEEWMVDYALRQVVTKLGPARKRKVSLLVEAFEKVMPAAKWDLQLRQHGSGFDQPMPVQACR